MSDTGDPPQPPSWLGDHARRASLDEGWWVIGGNTQHLTLGDVPADARLRFAASSSRGNIDATTVHPDAELELGRGPGRISAIVNAEFRTVHIEAREATLEVRRACKVRILRRHELHLDPPPGRAALVQLSASDERLTIARGDGLTSVIADNLAINGPLEGLTTISVAGSLSGSGGSAAVVGRAREVSGELSLGSDTVLKCDSCEINTVTGANITAKTHIRVGGIVGGHLTVTDPVDGQLAVAVNTATQLPEALDADPEVALAADIAVGRGAIDGATIVVTGNGDVTAGVINGATITTQGAVAARQITQSNVTAGRYVLGRELIEGSEARARIDVPVLCAPTIRQVVAPKPGLVLMSNTLGASEVEQAGTVTVRGEMDASTIHAGAAVTIGATTASTITAAQVQLGPCAGSQLTIGGGTIESSDGELAWNQVVSLQLRTGNNGLIRVAGQPADDAVELRVLEQAIAVDAGVSVRIVGDANNATAITLTTGDDAHIAAATDLHISAKLGANPTLTISTHSALRTEEPPERLTVNVLGTLRTASTWRSVRLSGTGTLVLVDRSSVERLSVEDAHLEVEAGATVSLLAGRFRARRIAGHIAGDPNRPPVLLDITDQFAGDPSRAGSMEQVDITHLDFGALRELSGLRVLDPVPSQHILDAKQHGGGWLEKLWRPVRNVVSNDLFPPELPELASERDRASWYDELGARTEEQSLTGAAASAISWARHYLHHRRDTSLVERAVRYLHQSVGYGFRPGPALTMLAAVTFAITLVGGAPTRCEYWVEEHNPGGASNPRLIEQYCIDDPGSPRDLAKAWGSVVIAPTKLIRITDATSPLPYFPPPVDSAANAAISLTFLFTVLSIRNYFRINPLS